ncbi:hypothetical protein CBER1_08082 [Cercospora berteroae]|uniref:Uncharacterized protein n=1 Tax=Cercospora berteroae TaxID=357750 RepID=A0A2S6CFC3_9PEZI|nr:hypothetical protein CBER1_08082 [Cercospora berteroae]
MLQIPQEIRDAIFDEILESEKNAGVWFTKKPTLSPGQEISLHPLFRVCYQLREEFAMKFWKKISISQMATSIWIIERRMTKLDPKHKKFITRVEYNAGSKYEVSIRGLMQIATEESATRIAKGLEDQLGIKPESVWVTFPNRFDKEMACWFNHARVNSLGEVEEREIAWE